MGSDQPIVAICTDSRQVRPNCLFIAIRGTQTDGHQYIETAIQQGATAIVCEQMPNHLKPKVAYVQVENTAKTLGIIAANFYEKPSEKLQLVGITGTNGKTSTATLLYKLFSQLGYRTGLISTVEYRIAECTLPSTHTTPDVLRLNQLLSEMVNNKCEFCFMEVSSHSVVQERITNLHFAGGIFSNITHDHLDYHGTFSEYIKAKKGFFDQLPPSAFALTNKDDRRGMVMLQNTSAHKYTMALLAPADFKAKILENTFEGLLLNFDGTEFYSRLIGEFNAYNLLAVYATAVLLGEEKMRVLTTLSNLNSAEGRFDYIRNPQRNITGIVDYAHTPDALQKVLETIAAIRTGNEQIIALVGCGGDRDKSKRPEMARVACEMSDKVILTSDNPRSENPDDILDDMQKGVPIHCTNKVFRIADRRKAIETACQMAQNGDIILLAGKGHEKYQEIKGVKHPFDDKEVLNKALGLIEE